MVGPRVNAAAAFLWDPRRRTRTLLAIGVLAAVACGAYLWRELPAASDWQIQGARLESLEASVDVLDEGGPPLLVNAAGSTPAAPKYDHALSGGNYPGLFVFLPVLAAVLGISVLSALKLLLLGLFLAPIAYYPLVFYRLTGSALAAVVSPFLLAYAVIDHAIFIDVYWILAWVVLALLPAVLLAWRIRGRAGFTILLAAMLAASFASSIRGGAGLGILIAGAGVVVLSFNQWSKLQRAGATAALIAAYLAVSPGLMTLLDENARSFAGDDLVRDSAVGNNAFHIAYIGLGYQPNDDGIYWLDEVGFAHAQREDPTVTYLGPGYNDIMREQFFDRVSDDPWSFVGLVLKKMDVALLAAGATTLIFVVLAALALRVLGSDRRLIRAAWLIGLAPLILGIAPGLVGIPGPNYVFGSTGVLAFLEVVEWALLLTLLGSWAGPRIQAALAAPGLRSTGDSVLIVGGGTLATLVLAGPGAVRAGVIVATLVGAALILLSSSALGRWRIGDHHDRKVVQIAALASIALTVAVYAGKTEAARFDEQFITWQADVEGQQQSLGGPAVSRPVQ